MRAEMIEVLAPGLFVLATLAAATSGVERPGKGPAPTVPRTWDDAEMVSLEVPLADPGASPVRVPAEYYYRIPARTVYRSYPVYAPGKEPPGYVEWLEHQEPQVAFDPSKLATDDDWVKAGEVVFDEPTIIGTTVGPTDKLYVRDPAWLRATGMPTAADGTIPFFRYLVTEKGKVKIGTFSCAMCHTRVMPDGSVIKGAQGNFPFGADAAYHATHPPAPTDDTSRTVMRFLYGAPWMRPDPLAKVDEMTNEDIARAIGAIPAGTLPRHGTSLFQPAQATDLVGVKDRRYLDHTGLQQHRSIADLMRYAALNQGGDFLSSYGGFRPVDLFGGLPKPETQIRYSDEQLYALALYVYSLAPPTNPNRLDGLAARGQKVFEQQGCATCHTPPLYTNNKLTPVDGFTVPEEHKRKYDILPMSVGTDPNLALMTRRGTGYYKVPSLKGVWYRGPFEHNGSVATLEDWFDAKRLRDDYVPTGFKGYGTRTRAVKGHEFGLQLSAEDKRALIAFLKTL